jgi:hypothetical protein
LIRALFQPIPSLYPAYTLGQFLFQRAEFGGHREGVSFECGNPKGSLTMPAPLLRAGTLPCFKDYNFCPVHR